MCKRLLYQGLVFAAVALPVFAQQRVSTLQLVSSIKPGGQASGVSAYKNFALTGMTVTENGITGPAVGIFNVSDPVHPVFLGRTPIYPDLFFETHRALRIGQRDVLVVLYRTSAYAAPGGLRLFDISNPSQPLEIGSYQTTYTGFHFEIAKQGARTLALVSLIRAEAWSSNFGRNPGTGDLMILDISDPTSPILVGEWGVIDEPALGLEFYLTHQQGVLSRDYGEGVWASADGRKAYYAYSDFGVMILDISNPSSPRFLGRVGYEPADNGDAHQVRIARGGNILVRSSIVRWPFQTRLTSNGLDDVRSAGEDANTPAIYSLVNHRLEGTVVPVGYGCSDSAYPADMSGKIALIELGGPCGGQASQAFWAQSKQAAGVIFYSPVKPSGFTDAHGRPVTRGQVILTGNPSTIIPITIPVMAVGWNTGSCLAQKTDDGGNLVATGCSKTTQVRISASSEFTGYGRIEVFDISKPSMPVKISTIGSEHSMDVAYELAHRYPPENPSHDVTANHLEIVGNTLYASFWADGLRVIDISQPAAPREIGAWRGEGTDPSDAPLRAWQVIHHNSLVLLNSFSHGVYILR